MRRENASTHSHTPGQEHTGNLFLAVIIVFVSFHPPLTEYYKFCYNDSWCLKILLSPQSFTEKNGNNLSVYQEMLPPPHQYKLQKAVTPKTS